MLTPLDIHNREFRYAVRGYREDEVDEFLDQVVRDFETLIKENTLLKDRLTEAEGRLKQYKQIEETLQNTLIIAQETAEEVKENARKEAQLIIREAEEQAKEIIAEGERRRHAIELQIETMKRETEVFRSRIRSLLESHIALLDRGWDIEDIVAVAEHGNDDELNAVEQDGENADDSTFVVS